MSSYSAQARKGLILLVLSGTLALSGCSGLRPVYGDQGVANARMDMSYGKPVSRLDQIIYQEFALRFGRTQSPDAPRLTVSTTSSSRALTTTSVTKPATQYQTTVTATAVLTTPDGRPVFTGSRSASAQYATVGQVLADTEASNEAAERAAREAAEGLRLAILGVLATPAAGQ
ncbi:MAG: hypothetical protein EON96_10640 [Caulobacteraceae bacterium]|nr:MAG: hypothetical protein EON96_10640 [Caulobacteraceae bacterium]